MLKLDSETDAYVQLSSVGEEIEDLLEESSSTFYTKVPCIQYAQIRRDTKHTLNPNFETPCLPLAATSRIDLEFSIDSHQPPF